MLRQCACCTMFVHSEARARAKSHKVSRCVHRQTGQEDVIFNMPPEHTQHSASAGCASSVLSAYPRVLAGPKPSVVRSHQEVGDLHLRVHVHLEVDELSASSARFSCACISAISLSSSLSFALDSSTSEVSSCTISAMSLSSSLSITGTWGCCLGSFGSDLVLSYLAIFCQELMHFLLPNSFWG